MLKLDNTYGGVFISAYPKNWSNRKERRFRKDRKKKSVTSEVKNVRLAGSVIPKLSLFGGLEAIRSDITLRDRMGQWNSGRNSARVFSSFVERTKPHATHSSVAAAASRAVMSVDKLNAATNLDIPLRKKAIDAAAYVGEKIKSPFSVSFTGVNAYPGVPLLPGKVIRKTVITDLRDKVGSSLSSNPKFVGLNLGAIVGVPLLAGALLSNQYYQRKERKLYDTGSYFVGRKQAQSKAWRTRRSKYGPNGLSGV